MNKLIAAIILCLASVATTRYLWPRVEYKSSIVEKEVIKRDVVTVIREIVKQDGSKETVTEIVDHSRENSSKSETVVKLAKAQYQLALLASTSAERLADPVYGLQIQRRLLGPVWGGLSLNTDKQITFNLGLEF
jgi:lipopolysaccharide export LptBFGC system permease protein LptF